MTSTIQNDERVEALGAALQAITKGRSRWGADGSYMSGAEAMYKAARPLVEARQSLAREPATADVERVRNALEANVPVGTIDNRTREAIIGNVIAALSRAAPSSEPVIAEGERVMSRQIAYAFCGKLKQSQKADVSERLGFKLDYSLPTIERDKQFLRKVSDAKAVGILEAAIASFLPGEFALAQSSTPPASKGVEADKPKIDYWKPIEAFNDAGEVEPAEYLCNANGGIVVIRWRDKHHDVIPQSGWIDRHWQLRNVAASPTPSNDTLQGRGEVGDIAERLRAAVTYQYMPMAVCKLLSEAAAALQKDTRHDG